MTTREGKVTCDLSISLDGYAAGHNQTEDRPFGDDGGDGWGSKLHAWYEDPAEQQVQMDRMAETRAFIMGRNMFGPIRGDWDRPWNGWWGDNPPYHGDVFVLTHHAREPQPMDGGTTFHFVTDGIESAFKQAREAAGDGDISIHGGASTVNQYLAAGPDRRAAAAHRADHARRGHPAVRRRPAAEPRAGGVARQPARSPT